MTPDEEAAVRADERLKVLREVRKAASKMNHNPNNDPYLWGYGARQIVGMLHRLYLEARDGKRA